jgi:hypothetical protein
MNEMNCLIKQKYIYNLKELVTVIKGTTDKIIT